MSQPPPPPPPSQPPSGDPQGKQPEGSGAAPAQPPQPPQQPSGGFGSPPPQPPQGGGYGYPQQPPPPGTPQGGYGYPQQPPGAPQAGAYGFPQQPPQPGYAYPPQPGQPGPYGQVPGMYPTAPPGGYGPGGPGVPGSGNGKVIAIVAAAVAAVLVIGTIGFFLVRAGDSGGTTTAGDTSGSTSGGGGKPSGVEGKELFKVESPRISGESKRALGAWATDKVFVKGRVDSLVAVDVDSGKEAWDIPLDGEICAASKYVTKSGKTAVGITRTKSSEAPCTEIAVIDLKSGKKDWQQELPDNGRGSFGSVSMTIAQDVVAANWIGGSAAYKISGGSPLWKTGGGDKCRDEGFAGGEELVAVVECGDYTKPTVKVQKLNPETGKLTWEFDAPSGVQGARVISSSPVVLAVAAGTSVPTDVMTVGDDGELKAKISLGDHKYDPGCSTETESCISAVADKKYLYMPSGQHQGDSTSTNEILAFDLNSGEPKWKSDAGASRTIVPIRMEGGKLIAYKKPTFDAGGQVVGIDPAAKGKQELYLRSPDDSARTESDLASISLHDPPLYVNDRLFLQRSLVSVNSQDSYGKYIGMGIGPK